MKNEKVGVLSVILSAVLFGTMPLLAKIAFQHGSNAYTVAYGRFFFGSIILFAIILAVPGCTIKVKKEELLELIKLSFFYALTPVFLYCSYNYIDSGMATTLHFTYPVVVILIMAVFCKAKLDVKQVVCTILCVGGVSLLYSPDGQMNVKGIVFAIASGIVFAIYIVMLGKSKVKQLPSLVLTFWLAFFSTIEIGIIALCGGNLTFKLDFAGWGAEIALGLLTTVFALLLFQKGVILCGEVKASLLSSFEPLTGIAIGVTIFHEVLSGKEIVGVVCIFMATIFVVVPIGRKNKA